MRENTSIPALQQERARVLTEIRVLNDQAEAEGRDLSAEEQAQWDKGVADVAALRDRIKRQEYLQSQPAEDAERRTWQLHEDERAGPPQSEAEQQARYKRAYREAFWDYALLGEARMSPKNRALLEERQSDVPADAIAKLSDEQREVLRTISPTFRAQEIGSQTLGGFWVPDEMQQSIEKAELFYGGMRQSGAEIITTETGADLPWPVFDDTANVGRRLTENQAFTETDVTVGVRMMKAYMYSSDEVLVSRQFLQDVPVRAEAWLGDALGERIGRITNTEFTTLAQADGPQGIIRASTLGVTAAGTATITADELLTLKYAVNRAYRNERTRYMWADATERVILQLKDGEGRYMFQPDPRLGGEPTIHGVPSVINNDMPALATGNITVEFGDFFHYKIRDVVGFTLLRLDEIRARNLQVVFLGFSRHDGAYINAGQNPIQHLIQA